MVFSFLPQPESHISTVWQAIIGEAREASRQQPGMASFFHANVLNHRDFQSAVTFYLAGRLGNKAVSAMTIQSIFSEAMTMQPSLAEQMMSDLMAHYERDAACDQYLIPLLYFKGFHAIQSWRIAHWLWQQGRRLLALYIQHRITELFDVDIHPAAILGSGIMLDHGTGLVIGETTVIGDDVSILHGVTLGGSGAHGGDRHPKVQRGVLLSAGAKLLGNITIGEGAKVGAGSVVLGDVPAHVTVAGVPARQVGRAKSDMPSLVMDHSIDDGGDSE
jgi:serine O-acetyltransferase